MYHMGKQKKNGNCNEKKMVFVEIKMVFVKKKNGICSKCNLKSKRNIKGAYVFKNLFILWCFSFIHKSFSKRMVLDNFL